ncbi:MAG: hypothetical protein JWM25_608 [Thermoleophilia bacterium]|nr:hypothetical protein [Thermoleophilia bacterium]MCZ4496025.1 hypothetical protein [Thermoleophilia bacterium]
MKQHVVQDQVALRYADGIDHVWAAWEPFLRRCEGILDGPLDQEATDLEELATQLRRIQYRAHSAAEFTSGLVPPPSALDAHAALLETLTMCRDVLGVLAHRTQLRELDEDAVEAGLRAVDATRDACRSARASTALVHAWGVDETIEPTWLPLDGGTSSQSRLMAVTAWLLVAVCSVLLVALVVEVFLIAPIG